MFDREGEFSASFLEKEKEKRKRLLHLPSNLGSNAGELSACTTREWERKPNIQNHWTVFKPHVRIERDYTLGSIVEI